MTAGKDGAVHRTTLIAVAIAALVYGWTMAEDLVKLGART